MVNAISQSTHPAAARRLVFVSHANPEENDFVRWLGVQLANAGYEVWSDVTKLIGGEIFWDDIEDAIRHHTAKFVLVVSAASLKKEGVKDEAALAVTVERSDKVEKFVGPIRIDEVPFSQFNANIARKNAIDFSRGWSTGLTALFEVLARDKIPCGVITPANVKQWCEDRHDPLKLPRSEPETLVSNWLPIQSLPPEISLFSLGVEEKLVRDVMSSSHLPWFPYFRLVGTFGSEVDLREDLPSEQSIQLHYRIATDRFLAGKPPEMPAVLRADARRFVVNLLRQGWDCSMAAKGLQPFEMANGAIAWFFPKGLIEKDAVHFIDHTGKRRRKSVVGRSEARKVFWHLGFVAKPVLGERSHFVMKAAVIFSEDGKKPLDSVEKMHRLRRGFCRNWWNGHWRDLMLAYITWISGGGSSLSIPFGNSACASVSATPYEFMSPVACADPAVKTQAAKATEEEDDPPDVPIEPGEEYSSGEMGEDEDD